MKNKYFTPNVEDIHAGYEGEMREGNFWYFYRVPYNDCLSDFMNMDDSFRTPYLTKEDIKAEGWIYQFKGNYCDVYEKQVDDIRWKLWYDESQKKDLEIFRYEKASECEDNDYHPEFYSRFKGECKSINEFRYICKLLKI